MKRSKVRRGLGLAALCTIGISTAARGQSNDAYTRWGGMRDRFHIDVGGFFVSHDTFALLRPSGSDIPGVDVERDAQIPSSTTDFRLHGYLRLGRRHRLEVGYFSMNRDAVTRLTGELEWDGEVFPVDSQVGTVWDTRVLSFQYRFSALKRERVDVGVSIGLFVMRVRSGIALANDIGDVGGDVSQSAPLPMLGIGLEWEFARGFMLRAGGQYLAISIQDTVDGHWGEFSTTVEWYPLRDFRPLGIGAGYSYTNIDVQLQVDDLITKEFDYKYKFRGPIVYAVLSF